MHKPIDINITSNSNHTNGLAQDCGNSSALAMELPQSCAKWSHRVQVDALLYYVIAVQQTGPTPAFHRSYTYNEIDWSSFSTQKGTYTTTPQTMLIPHWRHNFNTYRCSRILFSRNVKRGVWQNGHIPNNTGICGNCLAKIKIFPQCVNSMGIILNHLPCIARSSGAMMWRMSELQGLIFHETGFQIQCI